MNPPKRVAQTNPLCPHVPGRPGLGSKRFHGGSEAGQGTLEYLLILVIMVILILSLLYRFHGSFRNYAEAFFDGYIACLLETGELPGTGSRCASEYAAFNEKSGKMLLKDNLPKGKEGGGGQGGRNANANRGRGGGGGGEVLSGGSSRFVGNLANSGRSRVANVGNIGEDKSESSFAGQDPFGGMSRMPVGRRPDSGRPQTSAMYFTNEGGLQERQVESQRPAKAETKKQVDEASKLRPKRSIENIERRIARAAIEEEKGISIGGFIRFLIIALIIVAMIIFFGGQLIQIMRSREKGGGD